MHSSRRITCALLAGCLAAISPPAWADSSAEEATKLAGEGRYGEAVEKFDEAIRQEPKNASLQLGIGLAYQALRRYPEAVSALERAVKLRPSFADAYYSLGLLYEAMAADPPLLPEENADAVKRRYWQKARQSWEKFVRLSKDKQRVAVAKSHLERIAEALR